MRDVSCKIVISTLFLILIIFLAGCNDNMQDDVDFSTNEETDSISSIDDILSEIESSNITEKSETAFIDKLLVDEFGELNGDIRLIFYNTSSNMMETWYDYAEYYNNVPIIGVNIRVHIYDDEDMDPVIQGEVIASGFEEVYDIITSNEAMESCENKSVYTSEGLCYVYIQDNDRLPLCYRFSSEEQDIFVSAVTGEIVSIKPNMIIG